MPGFYCTTNSIYCRAYNSIELPTLILSYSSCYSNYFLIDSTYSETFRRFKYLTKFSVTFAQAKIRKYWFIKINLIPTYNAIIVSGLLL